MNSTPRSHNPLRGRVETESLSVRYGRRPALSDVTISVRQGEFILVTGPSGCGKSTLALALAGLIPQIIPAHVEGSARLAGLDTCSTPAATLAAEAGIVFQNPATQLFNNTVEEELAFAPRNLGLPADEIARQVEQAIQGTGIAHLRGQAVRHLSGGEGQRVAIASVLTLRPGVLILDEPTANLDRHGMAQIAATLERLNRDEGITIILIEHRLHPFISLAGRVLLMHEGHLMAAGRPADVLSDSALLARLGLRNPWYPVGPRFDLLPPVETHSPPADCRPLVELHGVSAGYHRRPVLDDLNLALCPGEFAALVGDNGAGKSTLARLLAGILRPKKGEIIWNRDLTRHARGRRVGLLFQNPGEQLLCDTVWEEVAFAPANFGLHVEAAVQPAMDATGLLPLRDRHPLALSMGQQQRTALAATLSAGPSLLILDEPTMGQDWGHLERLMDFLSRLHEGGHTILLISHDEKLVYHYAERIIVMEAGRIVADGPPRPAHHAGPRKPVRSARFSASKAAEAATTTAILTRE